MTAANRKPVMGRGRSVVLPSWLLRQALFDDADAEGFAPGWSI
jgi:hypothetical protein